MNVAVDHNTSTFHSQIEKLKISSGTEPQQPYCWLCRNLKDHYNIRMENTKMNVKDQSHERHLSSGDEGEG